mmetsp:Transcript_10231/g.15436  ORF Transcript_10231/g.15436 Transcript_10231/m.15436 type:complete len:94 (-) Transcript_10231:114-395(-)|eukprot:CAMPEP_0113943090 /NCGR_PEP_ID=MMETSP1339-20121228/19174_1 /TAXON_ID=94617 /ORGANISM="Fibrocapsa japonica" /LENGTH=93 /DNA_ID=CAMNT_0000947857 /DNA_START=86 /DNA_END=367 /DNA_ORIENTATION=- /assembly_acc=CAM_ASM_000762
MVGGYGDIKAPDEEVTQLIAQVKEEAEQKAGFLFEDVQIVGYKTQVVAGLNYRIKLAVNNGFVHVMVHRPLPHTQQPPRIMSVETGKAEADEL